MECNHNMRYTLFNVEHKDYQGKKYVKALARDVSGGEFEVSLGDKWGERLATFKSTDVIEANPWENPKSGKWSLYPIEDKKPSGGASGFKQKVIEETMARKEGSIAKFQDNKEWSIMVASSMNKAIDLAIAECKNETVLDTLEQGIKKWRDFIITNWEIDPKDYPPF
jgi:hypothetical protein